MIDHLAVASIISIASPGVVLLSNVLIVAGIMFIINWASLYSQVHTSKWVYIRFILMNISFVLASFASIYLPGVQNLPSYFIGLASFLPVIADFFGIAGVMLVRHAKQDLRQKSHPKWQNTIIMSVFLVIKCTLLYLGIVSSLMHVILFSAFMIITSAMAVWDITLDKDNTVTQEIIQGSAFYIIIVSMAVRIVQELYGINTDLGASSNLPYVWSYFISLMIINITLISQVTQAKIKELSELFQTDPLTGAWLRRLMVSKMEQEHFRFMRDNISYSIILLDIDDFKLINDKLGHTAGDNALKFVVDLIKSNIRVIDSIGRWGGEEFVILLPNTTQSDAIIVAEKIRNKLESTPFEWCSERRIITCSFGIAECGMMESTDVLITHADKAMYAAKNSGKSLVRAYSCIFD